ncbi:laminin subunit gamma-1-like isoform X2 [Lineus longissimus]|uniref:laminin subunit gamma-1-like isoform X2 n=1 Tax=Lineus longissimus TaxID=88925 RepID=UPI002B4EDEEF
MAGRRKCPTSGSAGRRFHGEYSLTFTVLILGSLLPSGYAQNGRKSSPCYDLNGKPQRCMPEFRNAAYQNPVESTNSCGDPPIRFCLQTGVSGAKQSCSVCDSRIPNLSHPPTFLTDFNNNENQTWWQSETMFESIQYPNHVNLTLKLGKAYDITYVRLKFQSPRPESFAIYKRTSSNDDWMPYQYYSASCETTYSVQRKEYITRQNEQLAICSPEYSDISPLSGGNIAFSTLEGRPSAYNFENSPTLQEWVTATDIRIVLTRLNTFGDEVFGDKNVLQSYFYAISDISIGGRCKCNGHASRCVESTSETAPPRLVCQCEHKTTGPDCGECESFYNDRPWARATSTKANECTECQCSGLATSCYFDQDLYEQTGHGSHCLRCRENTDGPQCEKCLENFYRRASDNRCVDCQCDPVGSTTTQCDTNGRCRCKPGVVGEKCDECQSNHYDFGANGCRQCECLVAGSDNNDPRCLPNSGICQCKEFVEGQNCDTCKPGYFNLDEDNPKGCISCFCYAHSSVCTSAPGYKAKLIASDFSQDVDLWKGVSEDGAEAPLQYDGREATIALNSNGPTMYFTAPERYLGDQRFSYDQDIQFTLRIGPGEQPRPSRTDLLIEGSTGQLSVPIYAQRNNRNDMPSDGYQNYTFRLNAHPDYEWLPRLQPVEFISILADIKAIKVRATYTAQGVGYLKEFQIGSAQRNGGREGSWVEQCTCPEGYVGQFCESCAPGYRQDPPNGGPYARCVPCNCNNHSDSCDVASGRCICEHNTAGDNCEKCKPGYYGYALSGTPDDCKKCPCPNSGECVELLSGDVACTNCNPGYAGLRCEFCADGYSGDPNGQFGDVKPCEKCTCNGNIDPNAVANCNTTSGECLKCVYNTAGANCDECLPGHWGDALTLPKGSQCKPCDCYPPGTFENPEKVMQCALNDGQCPCKPNVEGGKCDVCAEGYYNLDSGNGCVPCNCDSVGSYNRSCDVKTGQCYNKPGVGSLTAGSCLPKYYGFSYEGCSPCNCDPVGSTDLQCDERGQCPCKPNIVGKKCDSCEENKYNISAGCIACAPCYSLIQERVSIHRRKLYDMRDLVSNVGKNPGSINDTDFQDRMVAVNESVNNLLNDARKAIGEDSPLATQLQEVRVSIDNLLIQINNVNETISMSADNAITAMMDIMDAEEALKRAEDALTKAESYIDIEGRGALQQAREAQQKFGQQSGRMTEIAKEARDVSTQQEKSSKAIVVVADDALKTSKEALELAKQSVQKPREVSNQVEQLKQNATGAESRYNNTRDLAMEALKTAQDTYTESLKIYTEADGLTVPDIDAKQLKDDAQMIEKESKELKDEADKLISDNDKLLQDVEKQKSDAENLLLSGQRAQQVADELLADADVAKSIATDAISSGEKTLKDANDTLRILKEFDEKVKESKKKAEEALQEIPNIQQQIETAEQKTVEARNALSGAESDANMARDIAQEAQRIAEMAQMVAGQIKDGAESAKNRAGKQKDKAGMLEEEVDASRKRLEELEKKAMDDEQIIRQALVKADESKRSAGEASKKVLEALNDVDGILNQMAKIDMVDMNRLEYLEGLLAKAEEDLEKAKLDERYNDMLRARTQQTRWVKDYTDELIQLRRDVDNIMEIRDKLPDGCFKQIKIEVPQG